LNIAVCVKQVPDTETKVRIADDRKNVDEREINFILNPYDEFAVEEAIKTKEKHGGEITIISLGPDRVTAAIRNALAMGCDKAIHLKSGRNSMDPLVVANVLAQALREGKYDLIFVGKQAIDDDHAQMASVLSELLDIPGISVVTGLEISEGHIIAQRQIEGGFEKIEAGIPAVISTQRGLNKPRFASLKGIMAAKKIMIEERSVEMKDDRIEIIELNYPPQKPPGKIIGEGPEAVPELIRLLREEAIVIS
jgi:electron transfer flavoprotein beta subunit